MVTEMPTAGPLTTAIRGFGKSMNLPTNALKMEKIKIKNVLLD